MFGKGQGCLMHGEGLVVDLRRRDVPELDNALGLGRDGAEHGQYEDYGNFCFHFVSCGAAPTAGRLQLHVFI